MRILTSSLTSLAFAAAVIAGASLSRPAIADPAARAGQMPAGGLTAEEFSSQSKKVLRRSPRRVRIYGPREPGPNSVRICSTDYEYEYRLSGTVIVPREHCYWRG